MIIGECVVLIDSDILITWIDKMILEIDEDSQNQWGAENYFDGLKSGLEWVKEHIKEME